jgi:phospholipase D1/2
VPRAEPRIPLAWAKLIALGLLFFALFLAWRYTPLSEIASAERIMHWARAVGSAGWAPFAVAAIYTPAAFVMFPRPLITMFAAIAFGPWRGLAISLVGILGSAFATYCVGRALPERAVRRIAGRNLERATRAVRKRGLMSVFAVSVAPVAPFPVIGIVAGAVRIRLWHHLLGTMLGMVPGTLATTVFAKQIEAALEDPDRIDYRVVALVLAILLALVFGARRWMLRMQREP